MSRAPKNESKWTDRGFTIAKLGAGRNAIKSSVANELVYALNMLGKLKVVRGDKDVVLYADNGVTIQLAPEGEGGGSSEPVLGIAVRAKITALAKNYVTVTLWGGSAFDGTSGVKVAKPPELRHIASDTIYGVTANYTYPTGGTDLNDTNSRTAASSGYETENHKVVLPYEVDREIYVTDTGSVVGTETGLTGVTYIDLNNGGRTWASVPALPIP